MVVNLLMRQNILYWFVNVSLAILVVYSRFDTAIISVVIIILIFCNLGQSSSEFSPYSIFNKGCRYLLGDSRPEEIDRQFRGVDLGDRGAGAGEPSPYTGAQLPSKYVNRPCICGSGLKAKKCCMSNRRVPQAPLPNKPSAGRDIGRGAAYEGFAVVDQG